MTTYVFNGKVLPERADVNISPPMELWLEAQDAGICGKAIVSIGASQVTVVFTTRATSSDLATLRNYVDGVVRGLIDAYGYLTGRGYDVEMTSVVRPDGHQVVFGVGISELERSQDQWPLSYEDLLKVVHESQPLSRALADLREAIRSPMDTGFHCYRAIESLRQSFVEETDGDSTCCSWQRLRDALRVDRGWIDRIEPFGTAQRHGESAYTSGDDRTWMMLHAWKIVDRFCSYLHRGEKPLPEDEFELLRYTEGPYKDTAN